MSNILEVKSLTKQFGGLKAVDSVSFDVPERSVFTMIGPNGAGKTTLFNLMTGLYKPTEGDVVFAGRSIAGRPPHVISKLGISRTFQNIRLFGFLPAIDNVMIGRHSRMRAQLWDAMFRTPFARREEREVRDRGMELMRFVGIDKYADDYARNLAYGDQRRLEIARALASDPKVVLLDEPAAGLNPREKSELGELVLKIRETGVTVFLIEHDMKVVMGISEHIVVLDYGRKIAAGTPQEVRANPAVIEAYLGKGAGGDTSRAQSPEGGGAAGAPA